MMYDAIKDFAKQFEYEPVIENAAAYQPTKDFSLVGMGGSALAAKLLLSLAPNLPLTYRTDYGLPEMPEDELARRTIIASSYSGNTEETINGFEEAGRRGLPLIAIAVGGKLIELAKQHHVPYIQIPQSTMQPRSATGYMIRALMKAIGHAQLLGASGELAKTLEPTKLEAQGKDLAGRLKGRVPVVYASDKNFGLAYTWKIKFNETGKVPAFYNVFPELNHNEMTGFDVVDATRPLAEAFHFIFLKDPDDDPRIIKRMETTARLYRDRGLRVESVELTGRSPVEKLFTAVVLGDWVAYHTGTLYGVETEQVPMVEQFKKMIA